MSLAVLNELEIFLIALVILFCLGFGMALNLIKIYRRNSAYIPHWQIALAAASSAFAFIAMLFIVCLQFELLPQEMHSSVLRIALTAVALMGINGATYGYRLRQLTAIPKQTKNTLIQEQLLLQSVSQSQQNLTLKEKVVETKRKHLKSQMNPHFLFNVLTGVQHLLQNAESERASRVFHRFRRLLMLGFMSHEHILGPLSQEIEHVNQYVDLERIRLDRPITFVWNIHKDVLPELTPCPLFILQPLVENAIWHGLADQAIANPEVQIQIRWINEDLEINVCDNGSGLSKASDPHRQKHRSRGTAIVRERLTLLRHRGTLKIQEGLEEHPFPRGVTARLSFPLWVLEPAWNQREQRQAS
jgi:sensor histidine kinase YesM